MRVQRLGGFDGAGFGAVQLVPPILVGPVRALLQGQGLPVNVIDDSGNADGEGLLSVLFDKVTVHTRLSSPVTMNIAGGPADPATDAMLREIQPALEFSGRAGSFKIAPYGVPNSISGYITRAGPLIGLGIGGLLLGMFVLGGVVSRRTAPRRLAGYRRR